MATSTIFNFNFNNSEIVDSTGQWYDATTGTPTTEFIEHDGNTALLQRAYVAETSYTRNINPVFFQSRDPTFTAHTYTIELQIYPLRDSGGFGPESGPVLDFNPDADAEEGWVRLNSGQRASISNTFYWREYGLGPDGDGIPFLTVTAADGTYNRWYSIRIERVDDGTNTGATIKIYVDGTLVVNETLTYAQDARIGRIGDSIRYTYRRNSTDPQGAGVAIDNFKLTAGIAPSSVVDVSLANLQRNNANLLSFIKGKVPTVNNATLTIQKNGTDVATFSANSSTNATANITVPTKTSDLTNDSGFITEDTTKIPLAGSNQISGDLIPSTDGTVNLGSSSYQWNNAYIKSLTINGVACGDILTHNVSEFVDVSSNQTISGLKSFYDVGRYYIDVKTKSTNFLNFKLFNIELDSETNLPTKGYTFSQNITSANPALYLGNYYSVTPQGLVGTDIRNYKYGSNKDYAGISIRYALNDDASIRVRCNRFVPNENSATVLGSADYKWADVNTNLINGINPGALSLPGAFVNVDTTNWVLDGSNINSFTPTSDGWLGIQVTDTVYDQMHYVFVGRTGDGNTYYQQNVLSPINALWDGEYHGCVFIPVIKNVGYDIRCICSTIVATFYPCQGNV